MVLTASLSVSSMAFAGLLLVSGDSNIATIPQLNGSDNRTFFSNILGAGTSVKMLNEFVSTTFNGLDAYYDGLPGVTSTNVTPATPIDATLLAGVDLFLASFPADDYSVSELDAMQSFLSGGGTLFFLADQSFFATRNASINAALTALGSGMQIENGTTQNVPTVTNDIDNDLLTQAVASITYQNASFVTGGTSLIRIGSGTNQGRTLVAYESMNAAVPAPFTLALLGAGLLGFGLQFRQRHGTS